MYYFIQTDCGSFLVLHGVYSIQYLLLLLLFSIVRTIYYSYYNFNFGCARKTFWINQFEMRKQCGLYHGFNARHRHIPSSKYTNYDSTSMCVCVIDLFDHFGANFQSNYIAIVSHTHTGVCLCVCVWDCGLVSVFRICVQWHIRMARYFIVDETC